MRVEDLFTRERALHGPAGDHRQLADDDLVREGVGLAAETSAVCSADDADAVHRQLEHLGQRAVDVVHDLRRRPQRDLAADVSRDCAVLLHRQVRVSLEEENVLADVVGARETTVDVAELEGHELVDVVRAAVVLDALVPGRPERVLDRHHRLEDVVLDPDRVAGGGGRLLVSRGDGGDGVADVPDLLVLEGALVLRHRQDPELDRKVLTGDHGLDAWNPAGRRDIDAADARMRMRAAQDLAVQGAGQHDVVGVDRLAGDLGAGVDLCERSADDLHTVNLPAASSTAWRIFT